MNKPTLLLAVLALAACTPDPGSSISTASTGPGGNPQRILVDNARRSNDAGGGVAHIVGVRGDSVPLIEREAVTSAGIGGVGTPVVTGVRGDAVPVVERRR